MSLQQNIRRLPSASSAQCNLRRQRGATSIEYALLSALIAMFIVISVGNTGLALSDLWSDIADKVTTALQ